MFHYYKQEKKYNKKNFFEFCVIFESFCISILCVFMSCVFYLLTFKLLFYCICEINIIYTYLCFLFILHII